MASWRRWRTSAAAVAAAPEGDLRLLRAMQVHALRPRAPRPVVGTQLGQAGDSRSYANSLDGSQRSGNSSAARPATADGQWHSFGNASGGQRLLTLECQNRRMAVFDGNRGTGSAGTVRPGQGNEIYKFFRR